MVFIHETHVMPSSGKVKTKRYLFLYLVLAGSDCCPMCQLLQTGTNYHICSHMWFLYIVRATTVLVAPNRNILIHYVLLAGWHYID